MPTWLQYNGVRKTGIAAPRPLDRARDFPDWRGPECDACRQWNGAVCLAKPDYKGCPALGVRFRLLDRRDIKPSKRS